MLDEVLIVFADWVEHVEVHSGLVADHFPPVDDIGRDADHTAGAGVVDFVTYMEAHGALNDHGNLFEWVAMRTGLHAGLHPVHH